VSTGHADSPVTIVVGRAHKRAANPIGAAPRVVTNTAVLTKNMKIDEDLTGKLPLIHGNKWERLLGLYSGLKFVASYVFWFGFSRYF